MELWWKVSSLYLWSSDKITVIGVLSFKETINEFLYFSMILSKDLVLFILFTYFTVGNRINGSFFHYSNPYKIYCKNLKHIFLSMFKFHNYNHFSYTFEVENISKTIDSLKV